MPIDQLIPYGRNARTHSPTQLAQIGRSMSEFGFTNAVLIDEAKTIIAGHGRVLAAAKLWKDGGAIANLPFGMIPTVTLAHLTEAQRQAYVLADNRIALNAGWDEELLREELKALEAVDFDLSLIGFAEAELKAMLNPGRGGSGDPDQLIGEIPKIPITAPGDVWILGDHRLVCGDATNVDDVAKALGDRKPHLMVTDAPYGVEYDPAWRNEDGKISARAAYTSKALGTVENDDRADWRDAWSLFAGDVAYVWHGSKYSLASGLSLEACGFEIRSQLIWVKHQFAISRGDYHWQHEPCWYAVRKGKTGHWAGDRKQTTVWEIQSATLSGSGHDDMATGHGTQKPVDTMRRPIVNNSVAGDAIYEPFCGSGTTLIACEMEGRRCCALEISPGYCDVILRRWEAFAKKKASLEADGRSFDELAKERG